MDTAEPCESTNFLCAMLVILPRITVPPHLYYTHDLRTCSLSTYAKQISTKSYMLPSVYKVAWKPQLLTWGEVRD